MRESVRPAGRAAAALASLGLILLAACNKQPPTPAEIRPVQTVTAVAHAEGEPVSVTGQIRARTEESLAFRVDGRMIARRVDVGQVVEKGQLVAELDPQPLRDALRTAQANLVAAEATLQEATKNAERQRILNKAGVASGHQLDTAERNFQTAKAQVDADTKISLLICITEVDCEGLEMQHSSHATGVILGLPLGNRTEQRHAGSSSAQADKQAENDDENS
jgi:multidrug efflux pump subunit AcrA (membrane-fusion protein)